MRCADTTQLIKAGTAGNIIRRMLRPVFFANGDEGLVELARRLGVLQTDEHVE